jgi:hypothetical protein
MDVIERTKEGTPGPVIAIIDCENLLCESSDEFVTGLFEESITSGIPVPVEPGAADGGYELVKLSRDNPESVQALADYIRFHGYDVRDE